MFPVCECRLSNHLKELVLLHKHIVTPVHMTKGMHAYLTINVNTGAFIVRHTGLVFSFSGLQSLSSSYRFNEAYPIKPHTNYTTFNRSQSINEVIHTT